MILFEKNCDHSRVSAMCRCQPIFLLLTIKLNLLTGLAVRKGMQKNSPNLVNSLLPVLDEIRHPVRWDFSAGQQQRLARRGRGRTDRGEPVAHLSKLLERSNQNFIAY